jgi:hypothetical protein
MASQDEIIDQQELLAAYRRTLAQYRKQEALTGEALGLVKKQLPVLPIWPPAMHYQFVGQSCSSRKDRHRAVSD